ncbi:MAG TPA: hypothetical protein VNW97_02230 [Candidatus Saccharimonadales bacterium]|jgi:hypothetical protein|nr:hypothetical protein [Candidatus Saccharimonadales bacterium]
MTNKGESGMQCSQFEALLGDALDGALAGEVLDGFDAHSRICPQCGPLLAATRQGMTWLQELEEVEPPRNLVHNILAATSLAEDEKRRSAETAKPGGLGSLIRPIRSFLTGAVQPRFVTSFAMAFFSLSLTLTLAGVKFKDLARMDWRPGSVRKTVVLQYTRVENRVVKYYQNMRLVYEIESRVRALRKAAEATQDENNQQEQKPERNPNDDTSKRPENRQDRYSQGMDNSVIASIKTSHEGA